MGAGLDNLHGKKSSSSPSATALVNPFDQQDLVDCFQKRLAIMSPQLPAAAGLSGKMRTFFYSYDPLKGTTPNYWRCAGGVAVSAATWAAITQALANRKIDRAEFQAKVIEYGVSKVQELVQEHPLACGAVAGMVVSVWGLCMLSSSLKPVTEEGIYLAREYVVNTLLGKYQTVALCNREIDEYLKKINSLEEALINEQGKLKQKQQQDLQNYRNKFEVMSKRLIRVADDWSQYSSHSTERLVPEENVAAAIAAFTRFILEGDNSYFTRSKLVTALEPVVPSEYLAKLKSILVTGPGLKPQHKAPTGAIGRQCQKYLEEVRSSQDEKDAALCRIRVILRRYPGLIPPISPLTLQVGNIPEIPQIPLHVFKDFLPE